MVHAMLEPRIRVLETQLWRLKFALGTCATVMVAILVLGQSKSSPGLTTRDALDVEEIRIRDKKGNVRLTISAKDGNPSIKFLGELGHGRKVLFTESGFTIYGDDGDPRFGVICSDKSSELILFGRAKRPQIWLMASDEGRATGSFFDLDGKARLTLGYTKSDTGLALYDENDHARVILGTTSKRTEKRPISSLLFADEDGKTVWKAP